MGFFSNMFGVSSWSKEKLRDELFKCGADLATTRPDDWKDAEHIKAAQERQDAQRKKMEEIRAQLKKNGWAEMESFEEVMERSRRKG